MRMRADLCYSVLQVIICNNKKDRSLPIFFIVIRFSMYDRMFTRGPFIQPSGIIGFLIPKSYVYGGWDISHLHNGDDILLHLLTQIHGIGMQRDVISLCIPQVELLIIVSYGHKITRIQAIVIASDFHKSILIAGKICDIIMLSIIGI